jgi:flagellin-like protein
MRNTKKRGISPVIATVILVAIAIVISIAAAFWMTGLLSSFTAYEKITISASISKSGSPPTYTVTIVIVNDGTLSTNVTAVLINGVDQSSAFSDSSGNNPPNIIINPGSSVTITATSLSTSDVGAPGRPVKVTVVTLRGSYETQLTVP